MQRCRITRWVLAVEGRVENDAHGVYIRLLSIEGSSFCADFRGCIFYGASEIANGPGDLPGEAKVGQLGFYVLI